MKFLNSLISALFPNVCPSCLKLIGAQEYICKNCKKYVLHPVNKKSSCKICSYPKDICGCAPYSLYTKAVSPFFYAGKVRHSLHKMKFRNRVDLIKPFALILCDAVKERDFYENTDIVTFIPMTEKSQRKRGYNQAQLLAEHIAKEINKPCLDLLEKTRETPSQHSLDSFSRKGNLLGAFEVKSNFANLVKNKNILVVDDIITGGNTMNEAAKTLLIFGAENIYCAAIAFNPQKKKKSKI